MLKKAKKSGTLFGVLVRTLRVSSKRKSSEIADFKKRLATYERLLCCK
jgi:hypothetical protein